MNPKLKNLEMGSNKPPKKIPNYVGIVAIGAGLLALLALLDYWGIIKAV